MVGELYSSLMGVWKETREWGKTTRESASDTSMRGSLITQNACRKAKCSGMCF